MAGTRTRGIKSTTLRFDARDGRHGEVRLDPEGDAVFFTLDAVDRFLVPFYAARDGLDAALKFRAEAARAMNHAGAIIVVLHKGMCNRVLLRVPLRRSPIRK